MSLILAKREDGGDAIVLGCGGMATLAQALTKELGMPVIDGVSAAVKMVESRVTLGFGLSAAKNAHGCLSAPKLTGY